MNRVSVLMGLVFGIVAFNAALVVAAFFGAFAMTDWLRVAIICTNTAAVAYAVTRARPNGRTR